MIEAEQSPSPSAFPRVFYRPSELRAGWRLFIFLTIVVASRGSEEQKMPTHG